MGLDLWVISNGGGVLSTFKKVTHVRLHHPTNTKIVMGPFAPRGIRVGLRIFVRPDHFLKISQNSTNKQIAPKYGHQIGSNLSLK
jgi:hypothetical protein